MTITLTPQQEEAIQRAIEAGLVRSVHEFIETAVEALPLGAVGASSRQDAVKRMQEFGEKYRLSLGEPVTRKLLHEGHWT
jgi:Arc/MetJ-type ribon-helix-helix transcriptional regulator